MNKESFTEPNVGSEKKIKKQLASSLLNKLGLSSFKRFFGISSQPFTEEKFESVTREKVNKYIDVDIFNSDLVNLFSRHCGYRLEKFYDENGQVLYRLAFINYEY